MIKVEHINIYNFDGALRGMRNPLESWEKSDSYWSRSTIDNDIIEYIIGENDLKLAQKLIKAGTDHRKFMRQILASMDITASMSFWWDIDTYKVATEKNSSSRMHKLTSKYCRHLTQQDMNWSYMTSYREETLEHINGLIDQLQCLIKNGKSVMSEEYQILFEELIMDLPQGYLFTRTWTGNYEVLRSIYHARKNHKQKEIREFCKVIESLPYADKLIIGQ